MIRLGLSFLALFSVVLLLYFRYVFRITFGPIPWYDTCLQCLMLTLLLGGITLCLSGLHRWINRKYRRL
jgi:hypothetical protein